MYDCNSYLYHIAYHDTLLGPMGLQQSGKHPVLGNQQSGTDTSLLGLGDPQIHDFQLNGSKITDLYPSRFDNLNYNVLHLNEVPQGRFEQVRPHHYGILHNTVQGHTTKTRGEVHTCTLSFTNKYWINTELGYIRYLVFISDDNHIRNFYFWDTVNAGTAKIIECHGVEVGYIETWYTAYIPILFYHIVDANTEPARVFKDYEKEQLCLEVHGMSYTEYMEILIDKLIIQQDKNSNITDTLVIASEASVSVAHPPPVTVFTSDPDTIECTSEMVTQDFNDPSKTVGFLSHKSNDFCFIGPDRQTPTSSLIEDYILAASVIENCGLPNYKGARFPVHSNLNIDAWRRYLADYHDKRLLQYLTFGFPLSISPQSSLNNTVVTNHHSALQFHEAVDQYLSKEINLGAILGPFKEIKHPNLHCSPLLTRPKDANKRRIILKLSYPAGASLNDAIIKDSFDGLPFTLRFCSVDHISQSIRDTKGEVML